MPDQDDNTYQQDDSTPEQQNDAKLLETSLKRFELSVDAERTQREAGLDDLRFRAGEQWDADVLSARKGKGRPSLTINVLPARERQILNDQRQNRPAIAVHPVDDDADKETAQVFQGIIRHIEVDSNADVAYDTAMAAAVRTGGPGWISVTSEYEDPRSLVQVLKIKRVRNQYMIYGDPSASEPDRSDMKYLHHFCDYTKDEYKQKWPDSMMAQDTDWQSIGDAPPEWLSKDGIRVCEYWYIDEKPETIKGVDKNGKPVTRESMIPVVRRCVHNAKEILDKTEWLGRWIPFIPVLGDELDVDGKLIMEGMVRHVKDSVRMGNLMASAQMETIGMIPKAPWMVAEGQIPDEYKHMWETAHSDQWPYLVYKSTDLEGRQLPPPQRMVSEPAVQSITEARLQFSDDVKAVTGIYDAQLGQRSNEKSGTAILQRKQQGEIGNFHFVDNLTRAIRHLGRILIDLIPKIYDTPRVLRIIGEDGTAKTQLVNASQLPENDAQRQGVKHLYDLGVGTYDVAVSAGPSYQTKRLEAVATQLDLLKILPPQLAVSILDVVVSNMDLPQSEILAERLKKSLPPGLVTDDKEQPIPPQAQAKLSQQGQMIEQLTQALHAAQNKIEQKLPEIESRERIEKMKIEAQIAIAEITTKSQEALVRAKMEQAVWSELHGAANDQLQQSTDMMHEDAQRAAQQQHAQALSAQNAQQSSAQQQQAAQQAQQQPDDSQSGQ